MNIEIMLILIGIILLLLFNQRLKYSNFFQQNYADVIRLKASKGDYSVVAMGSNQTKFGFDTQISPSIYSWAMGPQAFASDLKILKQNIDQIKQGGQVIVVLGLFGALLKNYTAVGANDKYYLVLKKHNIPDYSFLIAIRIKIRYYFPLFTFLRHPRLLLHLIKKTEQPYCLDRNPMNDQELKQDAHKWVLNWLKQFEMNDIDAPLTEQQNDAVRFNQEVLSEMIETCKQREVTPYFAIFPVTPYLANYFTQEIQQKLLFDLIAPFRSNVRLLNYFQDERFQDKDLYFNSFFLNARGRKEFTRTLLSDINEIQ